MKALNLFFRRSMKLKRLGKFFTPGYFLKFRSMNVIIAVCVFVIFSFLLGMPIGQKKINSVREIYEKYNYEVLREIPDREDINEVVSSLGSLECRVEDGVELSCENLETEDGYALYVDRIEFEAGGIKKRITFVVDLFDIHDVYLELPGAVINYDPKKEFTLQNFPYEENVENYLVVFWSDALYFQAHPFGTDALNVTHNGTRLRTETMKIFFKNNIPDFSIEEDLDGSEFGEFLLEQFVIGNANTLKLRAYTLSFLVGVFFTLIIVLVIWIFFGKTGKLRTVKEYYNIASIASIPVFIVFFILLWFLPQAIGAFIFIFALVYLLIIYSINTSKELV